MLQLLNAGPELRLNWSGPSLGRKRPTGAIQSQSQVLGQHSA